MKKISTFLLLSGLLAPAFLATPAEAADRYKIDVVHSNVLFKVRHNDLSYVFGRFNDFAADITWDDENPENSSVAFTIQTESVDTHSDRRDQHLRSPDFFNARQFPEITFRSRGVKPNGDETYEVTGDVTLLGETKPVSFTWKETGSGPGPRGDFRKGGISTFTIKRSDFGMNFMLDRLSDEVELIVSVQAVKQ